MIQLPPEEKYKTNIARIYTSYDESVVDVKGAGYLVSCQYIVTCAHVVAAALGISYSTEEQPLDLVKLDFPFLIESSKQEFKAKVIVWIPRSDSGDSYGKDIAVLELQEKLQANYVSFGFCFANTKGNNFSVLGFPLGRVKSGAITKGTLTGILPIGLVQMNVNDLADFYISPGFSGAPVWDEKSKGFVGIVVSAFLNEDGQPFVGIFENIKVAYMIPAIALHEALKNLPGYQKLEPVPPEPNLMIEEPKQIITDHNGVVRTTGSVALAVFQDKELWCIHQGEGGKNSDLCYTSYKEQGWSKDIFLETVGRNRVAANDSPALVNFDNQLWCIYLKEEFLQNYLWYTCSVDGQSWSAPEKLRSGSTNNPVGITGYPALADFKDKLWCIHRGGNKSPKLWYTFYDPRSRSWSPDQELKSNGKYLEANDSPALVKFQNKLWCIYRRVDWTGSYLWYTCSDDGHSWSEPDQLKSTKTKSLVGIMAGSPALADFQGKLWCIHRGGAGKGADYLWYTFYDGNSWFPDQELRTPIGYTLRATDSPSLAVFDNKLYCIYPQDNNLWVYVIPPEKNR